jgi:hypothetical protein
MSASICLSVCRWLRLLMKEFIIKIWYNIPFHETGIFPDNKSYLWNPELFKIPKIIVVVRKEAGYLTIGSFTKYPCCTKIFSL